MPLRRQIHSQYMDRGPDKVLRNCPREGRLEDPLMYLSLRLSLFGGIVCPDIVVRSDQFERLVYR